MLRYAASGFPQGHGCIASAGQGRAGRRGGGSRPHAYERKPASDMHHVGYGLTWAGCAVSPPLV